MQYDPLYVIDILSLISFSERRMLSYGFDRQRINCRRGTMWNYSVVLELIPKIF
jgi:hypothetical protein